MVTEQSIKAGDEIDEWFHMQILRLSIKDADKREDPIKSRTVVVIKLLAL
ncbi:MAG: hypothetical protein ACLUPK_06245 [Veillonella sp.]